MTSQAPVEVIALDHVYIAVSDLARAEAFYDPVMALLGFKKGTKPISGEPHVHYYNRIMQYTLRPARAGERRHPYRVGALHHLCFRVRDHAAVHQVHQRLRALGIPATEPRSYEYQPDYFATFFEDPDGVRLEVVGETSSRRTLRERWHELEGFVDPLARLPARPPRPPRTAHAAAAANLRHGIPAAIPDELVTVLVEAGNARIERIVSRGHCSAPDFWYDQEDTEFVLVVGGAARLELEGQADVELGPGDWLVLEAHQRHRVAWTDPGCDTIWLAVFASDARYPG